MARLLWKDPFWSGKRKPFVIGVIMASLSVILMFLAVMSWIYGALFRNSHKVKALNVLAVDYDRGVIGQSLAASYNKMKGNEFPTLQFHTPDEYRTVEDIRNAVCRGDYWAAIFAQPDASNRLSAALGGGTAASSYNSSNTLIYVYNEIHYFTAQSGDIEANLQALITGAGSAYNSMNGTGAVRSLNRDDPNAIMALLNPISPSSINLKPSPQGTKVLYNTVTMVLPIIQQFFFLMALNGISRSFGIYGYLSSMQVGLIRMIVAITYTFIASLTVAGYIWAFRENWAVSSGQFVLTWMAMWLYMHVHFLVLDVATAFVPVEYISFFVLPWAIVNITAAIYPFELSAGFYRIGYWFPGHHVITILFQIWSNGCNNQLRISLPVLFAWEVVGTAFAAWGVFYRNKAARAEVLELETAAKLPPQTSDSSIRELQGGLQGGLQGELQPKKTTSREPSSPIARKNTGPPGLPSPFHGLYTVPQDAREAETGKGKERAEA